MQTFPSVRQLAYFGVPDLVIPRKRAQRSYSRCTPPPMGAVSDKNMLSTLDKQRAGERESISPAPREER
ncbi:MAG TPA: hypothetical protein VGN44_20730 [Candidatus Angelobacter sp.]|jgi:hypothetical protein